MRLSIFALVLAAFPLHAQFSVGIRGGIPITDSYKVASNYRNIPNRYLIGPTFEARLPLRFAVTFDLLYRKQEFQNGTAASVSTNKMDFPIMVRYRLGKDSMRPFIAAGPTFNKFWGRNLFSPIEYVKSSAGGVVFGAGVDLKGPFFHLAPELRITHYGKENFKDPTGALFKSKLNQADLIVGFTW
jgi:hypothetical protein